MRKQRFAKVTEAMLADTRLSCRQFKILCSLRMFADGDTGEAHPKKSQIAKATGIAENKIAGETRALVELGWIEKSGAGGFSSSAAYIVFTEPKTSPKTGLLYQPQKRAGKKKTTSPKLGDYQPQIGTTTSPKLGQNQPQIGATQVTDQQQTIEQTINRPVTATEKTASVFLAPADAEAPQSDSDILTAFQSVCRQTWEAYSNAYSGRYGADPIRNAKVNSQVVQFCKRVPRDEAPHVAASFVANNSAFYVGRGHQFGQLLTDAEKLRTEWATGRSMTSASARQLDATQTNLNAVDQALAMMNQRRNG